MHISLGLAQALGFMSWLLWCVETAFQSKIRAGGDQRSGARVLQREGSHSEAPADRCALAPGARRLRAAARELRKTALDS